MGAKTTLLGADFVTFTGTRSSMLTPAFLRIDFRPAGLSTVHVSSGYPGRRRAAVFFFPAM